MSVETLVSAAIQLSRASGQQDDLRETLTKWVSKTLKPLLTLPKLSELASSTSVGTVKALLATFTEPNLRKLAKSLDGHNTQLDAKAPAAISAHIIGLVTGEVSPVPKPTSPPKGSQRRAKPKPADPSMIRAASSRDERQALLESLTTPQLKSYIKAENLRPAGVPPKVSKPQLVHHILDELDSAEASGPRLLANSKYETLVPSR